MSTAAGHSWPAAPWTRRWRWRPRATPLTCHEATLVAARLTRPVEFACGLAARPPPTCVLGASGVGARCLAQHTIRPGKGFLVGAADAPVVRGRPRPAIRCIRGAARDDSGRCRAP